MKKNAAIGTDKLSEPLILIASAIVMAKQHSVIAKKAVTMNALSLCDSYCTASTI